MNCKSNKAGGQRRPPRAANASSTSPSAAAAAAGSRVLRSRQRLAGLLRRCASCKGRRNGGGRSLGQGGNTQGQGANGTRGGGLLQLLSGGSGGLQWRTLLVSIPSNLLVAAGW